MRSGTLRINWLWPIILIGLAALWLVQTTSGLPPAIADLISRAWPIALIALGLYGLFGGRVRLANVLIFGLSAILLAGIIFVAYNKQSGQVRQDYTSNFTQAVDPKVTQVNLTISTLVTQIDITPVSGRTVTANFVGSTESQVVSTYKVDQGVGTVTIIETRPDAIPKLDQLGRAKMSISLPSDVPISTLTLQTGTGDVTFDATGLAVATLNLSAKSGNISVTLPTLPAQAALGGNLNTQSGDLTLHVPTGLTLKLNIGSGAPRFDSANYLLLSGNVLESAGTRDFQAALTVGASGGVTVAATS